MRRKRIGSLVNFMQDWDRQNPTQIVTEMCGFVTILSGTFLLHRTKDTVDGESSFMLTVCSLSRECIVLCRNWYCYGAQLPVQDPLACLSMQMRMVMMLKVSHYAVLGPYERHEHVGTYHIYVGAPVCPWSDHILANDSSAILWCLNPSVGMVRVYWFEQLEGGEKMAEKVSHARDWFCILAFAISPC